MSADITVIPQPAVAAHPPCAPIIRAPVTSAPRQTPSLSAFARIGRVLLALPKFWWMALDAAFAGIGLYLGYWLFHSSAWGNWNQVLFWQAAIVLCPTVMIAGLLLGLHEHETLSTRSWIVGRVLLTTLVSALIAYAFIHVVLYDIWSRRCAAIALGGYALLGISFRLFASQAIRALHPALLFIGKTTRTDYMNALLADPRMANYGRLHQLDCDAASIQDDDPLQHIDRVCRANDIREIVIHSDEFKDATVLRAALGLLRKGRRVTDAVTFYEKTLHRVPVDEISAEWFLFADLQLYRHEQATLKRIFDVLVASIGLLVSLVLTPVIALAIRLDSPGPIFYSQDRIGLKGRVFRLHKFRTMTTNAEGGGIVWSFKGDKRVTRVGRFLRRTRLDELPQFWNILRGQMSIVGPRPERPEFVAQLAEAIPFYDQRHLIMPGLTGWAQVNYRYGSCTEDARWKLEYDLYYMKHMSLELDLLILLRTCFTVLSDNH
ncbi:MAG: sugar transferase [Phycisphaerales bacterium]|nr:MAG: sugar transferase [Phycisphaerales bacterium]